MFDNKRIDLVKYRLKRAHENLRDAELLFFEGSLLASNNRSYYAMFQAIRALFAMDAIDFKSHSAVIAHFRKDYIKKGLLDVTLSDMIGDAI